ncbi:MAG: DUF4271 domain-containing protein [Chitinophagaceae bacterium]
MKQLFSILLLTIILPLYSLAQQKDSILQVPAVIKDSTHSNQVLVNQPIIEKNQFINYSIPVLPYTAHIKNRPDNDYLFYLLAGLVLLLALLRSFFARYIATLFRVFFNTSLRQNQLTDQLLQSKLPSLLFNVFFFISGGLYIYFLFQYDNIQLSQNKWLIMGANILLMGLVYGVKYSILKFAGWITGNRETAHIYIFVVFMINKIIGILLLPLVILLVFANPAYLHSIEIVSFCVVGLLLLLRYFKSFGLLQNRLKMSTLHFILLISSVEILPLLLIYKALMLFLNKNA